MSDNTGKDVILNFGKGVPGCQARDSRTDPSFPWTFCRKRDGKRDRRVARIGRSSVANWLWSYTSSRAWPTIKRVCVLGYLDGRSTVGVSVGLPVIFLLPIHRVVGESPIFPPLDHAIVKAIACERVAETKKPISRQSLADVTARARTALGKSISKSTVWRILDSDR